MTSNYEKYISDVSDDIQTCLEEMGCQPILFVGSGFTKRYINGPSWEELLLELSSQCPTICSGLHLKPLRTAFNTI